MKNKSTLAGIGNKPIHQYIISDLIFAIRKKLVAKKIASKYGVLSEITLSEIGYETTSYNFSKNHNIDIVVIEKKSGDILFLAEIEREGMTITSTKTKIAECLKTIPTIREAFIIKFTMSGDTSFELCELVKGKLVCTTTSSTSEVLDIALKTSLVSLR